MTLNLPALLDINLTWVNKVHDGCKILLVVIGLCVEHLPNLGSHLAKGEVIFVGSFS